MSKWYDITVVTTRSFLVEVEDNEDENTAMDIAVGESLIDGDVTGCNEGIVANEEELEHLKRYSNEIIPL